jgi:hypothetical protein
MVLNAATFLRGMANSQDRLGGRDAHETVIKIAPAGPGGWSLGSPNISCAAAPTGPVLSPRIAARNSAYTKLDTGISRFGEQFGLFLLTGTARGHFRSPKMGSTTKA